MSSFAEKQLLKYGWKGKGLGKNENGITEPLKALKKKDNTGLGADRVDFFPWWDALYNKASQNIKVLNPGKADKNVSEGKAEKREKKRKREKEGRKKKKEDKEKKSEKKKSKEEENVNAEKSPGAYFVETQCSTNSYIHPLLGEIDKSHSTGLTNNELFDYCGKRCAWKGSRASMDNKLARLENL